ncbi:MAG: hypothetical protein ABI051_00585 [Vicinamibacterales bacterium]
MKKTLFILIAALAVAVSAAVAVAAKNEKVDICHKSPAPGQTLSVAQPAVAAHIAHGDTMGACSVSPSQ